MSEKITVYHNNSCSKSRAVLEFLDENGIGFEIINFIDHPLSAEELKDIIKKLGSTVHEIVRKDEKLFREKYEGKNLSEEELVQVLVDHPELIQRPILVKGSFAMVGRPVENVRKLIEN